MSKQQQLISFMREHQLSSDDVAEMLDVSEQTVRIWRCKNRQGIPASKMRLLELLLKEQNKE